MFGVVGKDFVEKIFETATLQFVIRCIYFWFINLSKIILEVLADSFSNPYEKL